MAVKCIHQLSLKVLCYEYYISIFTVLTFVIFKGRCNMFIDYLRYFASDVVLVLRLIR